MDRIAALARAGLLTGVLAAAPAAAQDPNLSDPELIARGQYLVTAGDCVACHTAPGGKPFAGNYRLNTPIGAIMTPNLTPDPETGIGKWDYATFERAFRQGIGDEGEYLYPAFPFAWYTKVTDADTKAIFAFLKSLPPVKEARKDSEIPFPFNVRTALITWRTAFFGEGRFKPDPKATEEVNRGAYLVEGLGHCGMCHNERKLVGNTSLAGRFGGGVIDGWYAPNITPDGHQGIGAWSDAEVVSYLKTGTAPGSRPGVAAGPMRQTIEESLSKMTDADLAAMVAYLRTVPAKQTYQEKSLQAFDGKGAPGASTYLTYCSSCHQPDGKGIPGAVPALAGNTSVQSKGPETVLRVIYGGLAAQSGYAPMPAIGQEMTDVEVRNVTDYIRNSWGNSAPVIDSDSAASDARAATQTMLAGNAPCAEIAQDGVRKAFDSAGAAERLKGLAREPVTQEQVVPILAQLLPQVKAAYGAKPAETGGQSVDDALVNGLTSLFCQVGKDPYLERQKAGAPEAARPWASVLGSFASIAYSQARNPEKRASAGTPMPSPARP